MKLKTEMATEFLPTSLQRLRSRNQKKLPDTPGYGTTDKTLTF